MLSSGHAYSRVLCTDNLSLGLDEEGKNQVQKFTDIYKYTLQDLMAVGGGMSDPA